MRDFGFFFRSLQVVFNVLVLASEGYIPVDSATEQAITSQLLSQLPQEEAASLQNQLSPIQSQGLAPPRSQVCCLLLAHFSCCERCLSL